MDIYSAGSDYAGTYRILARDQVVSNDSRRTGLNNNDLIIGSTGSGKTRYYVKPNLMQLNESSIVMDTKGLLVREVGPVMRAHGCRVLHIDFTHPERGMGYNPLDFIARDRAGRASERDIMRIAHALCPIEDPREPFWERAAQMYIACLIGYTMEFLPEEEHTLTSVLELASGLGDKTTDRLMAQACAERPKCFAARKWRSFSAARTAEKMHGSILGIVAEKLDPLTFDGTARMFSRSRRLDFKWLGERKTAVFLTVSDTDRSLDRLVSLFYSQALQELCAAADARDCGALPTPVRLYLDDFATNCRIPDFDKTISVIRSRNISVSVVLQSITQLASLYGAADAMTIINGCDHLLYLGGQDVETSRFIATKAGRELDEILNQPVSAAWLFERGRRARQVQRYDLAMHRYYWELPEVDSEMEALFNMDGAERSIA